MSQIRKIQVTTGVYWIEIPEVKVYILCGCPADAVKHLMKRGLIVTTEKDGVSFETGPNIILLSDVLVQNGSFSNLSEFPVLQMLYRQGMILPGHPNNTGEKPMIIGSEAQVKSQMEYIYRGNYGLTSAEEMIEAGASPEAAHDMMRLKLKFAFGTIRPTEELLASKIVGNEPTEIKNNVFIKRIRVNVFEIEYNDEHVTIDLNISAHATYESAYPLGYYNIKREYFGIIHSGEGDGWDINRPTMSSILMFQGRVYLIDAGPNMLFILNTLGIGVNEIEGIFHTHSHDDHFCGIPTLMRTDQKIKYYATPLVRDSVIKKLTALLGIDENQFYAYFDVVDLEFDVWNNVNGLDVRPVFSPHPVETNIFTFRAMCEEGYLSYSHFADIVALDLLEGMITEDKNKIGISRDFFDNVKKEYLSTVNIKKLDVGGGMIHGKADDFKKDMSEKLILSHTAHELTNSQKAIGSGAPFGMTDILIPSNQDYSFRSAYQFLRSYFPGAPFHQIYILLNNQVLTFNPQSILIKNGVVNKELFLIISGNVEMIHADAQTMSILSAGALIGEMSGLIGAPSNETFRAASFVMALRLPSNLYLNFVKQNGLYSDIEQLQEKREFLQKTWLFGEAISYPIQNKLANEMVYQSYAAGEDIPKSKISGLSVIKSGKVQRYLEDNIFETLGEGKFFGEESILFNIPDILNSKTIEETEIYFIHADLLADLPVIRIKLTETYEKRKELILHPEYSKIPVFSWRHDYSVNVEEMDNQHKEMFNAANELYEASQGDSGKEVLLDALDFLIRYTEVHFHEEEKLMRSKNFPDLESHQKKHAYLIKQIKSFQTKYCSDEIKIGSELIDFLKDWIVNHILREDRQYGQWLTKS
ncbi:MAG: bacteriohemerythrin [Candidatus Magnetomorum sp.]|nr:bacteriohemerythrin [Candidatus Magnetomorum sp.]